VRNEEVRRSVEDLVALAAGHPRENPEVAADEADVGLLRSYFSGEMYKVRRVAGGVNGGCVAGEVGGGGLAVCWGCSGRDVPGGACRGACK
jgi:hypothetical protein